MRLLIPARSESSTRILVKQPQLHVHHVLRESIAHTQLWTQLLETVTLATIVLGDQFLLRMMKQLQDLLRLEADARSATTVLKVLLLRIYVLLETIVIRIC